MNKKFSTLLATLLVAGGMTSTFAVNSPAPNDGSVKAIEEGKAYQLYGGSDQLLVMTNTDGVYKAEFLPTSQVTDLNSSLWTISYVSKETSGPDFTLVNKARGTSLSVDLKELTTTPKAVNMGGNVSSWKWYPSVKKENGFSYNDHQTVKSYFTSDSVVYLTAGVNGEVMAAKEDVNKIATIPGQIEIAPVRAAGAVLTAKDLNTKLGTDVEGTSFKLSATPELKVGTNSTLGDMFTKNAYRAWNLNPQNGTDEEEFKIYHNFSWHLTAADYVMLQVIDKTNDDKPCEDTYLMADTVYIPGLYVNNEEGVQFTDKVKAVKANMPANGDYVNNFGEGRNPKSALFKFTYYPTEDSLAIDVLAYNKKDAVESSYEGKNTAWTIETTNKNSVILNQLTASNELTLGAVVANQSRNIKFMLNEGTTNRVSKDNGVYVIKNKKGQYLAAPIYNTYGANAGNWTAAEWVTVIGSEQDVMRMPAYQWVMVKKDSMTVEAKKISAMTITNREFEDVANTVQFRHNEGGEYLFADLFTNDSLKVEAVAADVIANEALGYLNLEDENLKVMSYKFNYLHAYAEDKFMGMLKDSVLNVKDSELSFFMEESAKANYGYTTKYVAGLKQLTRVTYTPYVKTSNGKCYITIDAENRYKLTDDASKAQKFYLKENNFYQPASKEVKQPYYAFINVAAPGSKMGSSDQDLSVILRDQVLNETRTSAFAVVPNNAPLYRRFLTEEGKDEAQLLKFYEYYVNDYLMDETNEKFQREGVNYLGIGAEGIAAAGLSFKVRPYNIGKSAAYQIKPQYLVIVNESVNEGKPAVKCNEDHMHYDKEAGEETTDPYKCFHAQKAVKGFDRYKLLVSFADSVETATAFVDQKYHYGTYSRVGFVDAVEQDSVLYILGDKFVGVSTNDLTIDAIKEAGIAGIDMKADVKKDEHKNYTWSFRYINPEKVADATEENLDVAFLIESNVDPKGNTAEAIAPMNAAWIRQQNNCLVLSDPTEAKFENAKTGGDAALIFNAEAGSEDDMATENEVIATSTISVVAADGGVIVKGAEGRNIVITNVLGQTIANTVVSSSEATIAAPAGVVVVAVEGEAAVKAIVK